MIIFFIDNCNIVLYTMYDSQGGCMKIVICNSSPVPIYEQIKNAIVNQIMSGELEEGSALPSIRSLALDIKISVMTIKKAYDELEKEGYLVSVQGKGTFVAPKNVELAREQAKIKIEEYLSKAIDISSQFGIDKKELIELLKFLMESEL